LAGSICRGFTDRLFAPCEQHKLLARGCGITNLVERATVSAAELSSEELIAGAAQLQQKALVYRPRIVAILGVTAFRTAFGVAECLMGHQPQGVGPADLWVLPNPSGLNAHYTPSELASAFRELRTYGDAELNRESLTG
jgi:TDG/mug DNA glycosylase family protein